MSTYVSTTDHAAEIRQAYKKLGWTSRDVSVRADYYSMGSAIRIELKSPKVNMKRAKAIAEGHESIDRDQFGEILSGGNRFVTIRMSDEYERATAAPYLADVQAAMDQHTDEDDRSLFPVGSTGFLIGRPDKWRWSLWRDGFIQQASDAQQLALAIGLMV